MLRRLSRPAITKCQTPITNHWPSFDCSELVPWVSGVVLPSVLRLRLIVAALRLAVAIRSGLRHAERSSANAQILASRGVLRDGLAVIVVNRYFLLGNVAIEEVGNGRSRDCRTIPIAVVPAVDGNVEIRLVYGFCASPTTANAAI